MSECLHTNHGAVAILAIVLTLSSAFVCLADVDSNAETEFGDVYVPPYYVDYPDDYVIEDGRYTAPSTVYVSISNPATNAVGRDVSISVKVDDIWYEVIDLTVTGTYRDYSVQFTRADGLPGTRVMTTIDGEWMEITSQPIQMSDSSNSVSFPIAVPEERFSGVRVNIDGGWDFDYGDYAWYSTIYAVTPSEGGYDITPIASRNTQSNNPSEPDLNNGTFHIYDFDLDPDDAPTLSGHSLLGYSFTPNGPVDVAVDGTIEDVFLARCIYLFPVWETTSYNVTFISNGETYHETIVEAGSAVPVPTEPELYGYTFQGWFTDESFTEPFDFSTIIEADTTLYAKWEGNLHFTSDPSAAMNVSPLDSGTYLFDATPSTDYLSVLWDFGDGTTSTETYVQHYYSEPGPYTVTLTVYNDFGSDTVEYELNIAEDGGTADGDDGFPWLLVIVAVVVLLVIVAVVIRIA